MAPLRALLLAVVAAVAAQAQTPPVILTVDPAAHPPATVRAVRRLLADSSAHRLVRDTVLAGRTETPLVVFADVTLEGDVAAPVAVVGGVLRLRPGARASGPVYLVGGDLVRSGAAGVGDVAEAPPGTRVDLERRGDTLVARILLPPPQPRVVPAGLAGVLLPEANRVDGLVLRAGLAVHLARYDPRPRIDLRVTVPTARAALEGTVRWRQPIRRSDALEVEVSRGSSSPDTFFRSTLANSVATLVAAADARNYAHRTALSFGFHRDVPPPQAGRMVWRPMGALRWERYASLPARDIPRLRGRPDPNPPVDSGTVVALVAGVEGRGAGRVSQGTVGVVATTLLRAPSGPWAQRPRPTLQLDGRTAYETVGLRPTHRLHLAAWAWIAPWPIPRMFWRAAGYPFLPTEPHRPNRRGDNGYAVEASYRVAAGAAPLVGPLELELLHRAASAWARGRPAEPGRQALGLGIGARWLRVRLFIDPTAPERRALALESPLVALP